MQLIRLSSCLASGLLAPPHHRAFAHLLDNDIPIAPAVQSHLPVLTARHQLGENPAQMVEHGVDALLNLRIISA